MSAYATRALLDDVAALALRAGEAILSIYGSEFAVEHKSDASPLTAADLASQQVIVAGLKALTPDIPILSEEASHAPFDERRHWPRCWLVDPLDGTREFVKRNGEFTVNIALIEGSAPVLGVVSAPALDEIGGAVHGAGGFVRRAGVNGPLAVAPAHAGPLRIAGSRSHGDPRMEGLLARVGPHELHALGSALKFLRLAAGEVDLYVRYGLTSEWDTAAGHCLVEVAGGRMSDLGGAPMRYNRRESLLNPDFVASASIDPRVLARYLAND